jgi:archaeal flagellar protein FlaJ
MKFKQKYLIGISIGAMIFLVDTLVLLKTDWFVPVLVVALSVAWVQIWMDFFLENQKQKEIETRFLDFVRNLAGAIRSGMPVSKSIIHVSNIDYGALSPYIRKLGHQVEWSIPVHKALLLFSSSTKNDVIRRAVATVIEAEQSGGNMEDVLEAITTSLIEIKKIKEQRKAGVNSQVMQSYIIFIIFMGVMLVIQNMLVPFLVGKEGTQGIFSSMGSGASSLGTITGGTTSTSSGPALVMDVAIKFNSMKDFIITLTQWFSCLRGVFLMLTLIQAFFAGVIIGKMAEGDITSGLKHSVILMTIAMFVMTLFKPG